ncbi:uncharacterized protein [Cherax quadricarinatus]|uniref:uncharacterized protein n=1 Tax=Cherax quadricarinatus TaxID=27406 RepID=UPI00387E7255
MAVCYRRRVNTIGIELLRGAITPSSAQILLPKIIRETYGIQDSELYGVALNGAHRVFVKLLAATVYESVVTRFQDVCFDVTPAVRVRLVDVSRYYTWIKLRNVPFEANEADIRNVFEKYGTVHSAQQGKWIMGAYTGMPEGTFSLKMTLRQPIPSYVYLQDFRTQVMVLYPGQRRTCRICGEYDHIAAACEKNRRVTKPVQEDVAPVTPDEGEHRSSEEGRGRLWSEMVEQVFRNESESFPPLPAPESLPIPSTGLVPRHDVLSIGRETNVGEDLDEVLRTLSPQVVEAPSSEDVAGDFLSPDCQQYETPQKDDETGTSGDFIPHCEVDVEGPGQTCGGQWAWHGRCGRGLECRHAVISKSSNMEGGNALALLSMDEPARCHWRNDTVADKITTFFFWISSLFQNAIMDD